MSFFEELADLDRPWVDVKYTLRGKKFAGKAIRPNAAESDALEAFYADEYSRLVVKMTEPAGSSELDKVRTIYTHVSREELIDQLVDTRAWDIQRETVKRAGIDVSKIVAEERDLSDEERKVREDERNKLVEEVGAIVTGEIRAEYEAKASEELVETLAQININVKAQRGARKAQNAQFLFCTMHDENLNKVFPSATAIRDRLTSDTIEDLKSVVDRAFANSAVSDLPFVLADAPEQDGQASSPSTSEADTPDGGRRTKRTRASSKSSTTQP